MPCKRFVESNFSDPCDLFPESVSGSNGYNFGAAQSRAVLRLGAITLGGTRLARFSLSVGGYDGHDRNMEVRCVLVHVEMRVIKMSA